MEGSSATSPLGEPIVSMATTYAPALSAMESVNSAQNQDFSDGSSFAEINYPMLVITDSSTLKMKQLFFQEENVRPYHLSCPCQTIGAEQAGANVNNREISWLKLLQGLISPSTRSLMSKKH